MACPAAPGTPTRRRAPVPPQPAPCGDDVDARAAAVQDLRVGHLGEREDHPAEPEVLEPAGPHHQGQHVVGREVGVGEQQRDRVGGGHHALLRPLQDPDAAGPGVGAPGRAPGQDLPVHEDDVPDEARTVRRQEHGQLPGRAHHGLVSAGCRCRPRGRRVEPAHQEPAPAARAVRCIVDHHAQQVGRQTRDVVDAVEARLRRVCVVGAPLHRHAPRRCRHLEAAPEAADGLRRPGGEELGDPAGERGGHWRSGRRHRAAGEADADPHQPARGGDHLAGRGAGRGRPGSRDPEGQPVGGEVHVAQELDGPGAGEAHGHGRLQVGRVGGRRQHLVLLPDRHRPRRIVEPREGPDHRAVPERDALPVEGWRAP